MDIVIIVSVVFFAFFLGYILGLLTFMRYHAGWEKKVKAELDAIKKRQKDIKSLVEQSKRKFIEKKTKEIIETEELIE
jgi:hypothetical protein